MDARISNKVVTSIQVEENYQGTEFVNFTVSLLTMDAGRKEKPVIHQIQLGTIFENEDLTYKAVHFSKKEKSGMSYEQSISFLIYPQ